ncbi:MAG: helix-turn-helix domain-containing protein [Deltaproteobacteria bacterium]|nr:helix-turn-helix domain-containing protein [Deltaproteobacteria bacterium]
MNTLSYKYEIFPTWPQRAQLYKILRQCRYQWNKAVTIRKKLKAALNSGQFEHVVNACLWRKERQAGQARKGHKSKMPWHGRREGGGAML